MFPNGKADEWIPVMGGLLKPRAQPSFAIFTEPREIP